MTELPFIFYVRRVRRALPPRWAVVTYFVILALGLVLR